MRVRRYGGWLVVAGVAAVSVALSRLEAVRDIGAGPALILILTMLALWATGVIAEYLTAMVFFTAAILLGIASPEVTFSGFSSTAFWLIFPGLFIGVAVNQTGLGDRLARRLLARFPKSYVGVVFGNALLGVAMAFIMPSAMGRILLLLPIFAAIATRLGYQPRTRPYVGVVLSGIFGTFFPAVTILPANVPNVVLIGAAEAMGLQPPDFAHYLLLHFPVMGALRTVLTTAIVAWMYRGGAAQPVVDDGETAPMSAAEWRLSAILAGALVLWSTDSWHHISPAWVGMLAGIACLWPRVGVLGAESIRTINVASLFYIAAIIGLGSLVDTSGIGRLAAGGLLSVLPLEPGSPARDFALLSGISSLTGVLASQPGIPAVLTPLAQEFANASGLPLMTVLMTQVLGYATVFLTFQAPALVVAIQALDLPMREANKLCFAVSMASIVLLWPLNYLWWVWLGVF